MGSERLCAAAATLLDFQGELVCGVTRLGHTADIVVQVDYNELDRRRRHELGAVLSRDTLTVISLLPLGEEIPWVGIDPVIAGFLDLLPSGLVERTEVGVTRVYRPPLSVRGVLRVEDGSWSAALDAVSYFGRAARRGVVTKSVSGEKLRHARRLGIGIVRERMGLVELVVPASSRYVRVDELSWFIAESIFSQINQAASRQAAVGPVRKERR
jgi:hypothetical protein